MISFRQADLLPRIQPILMKMGFRYDGKKIELTSIYPADKENTPSTAEKADHLNRIFQEACEPMGFYFAGNNWAYNTTDPLNALMAVYKRLEQYGDERIERVRDSIGSNISVDRFTVEVLVK